MVKYMNEFIDFFDCILLAGWHGMKITAQYIAPTATGKSNSKEQYIKANKEDCFNIPMGTSPYEMIKTVRTNAEKKLCFIDDLSTVRDKWQPEIIALIQGICDGKVIYKTKFDDIQINTSHMNFILLQNNNAAHSIISTLEKTGLSDRLLTFRHITSLDNGSYMMKKRYLAKTKGKDAELPLRDLTLLPVLKELSDKRLNGILKGTASRQEMQLATIAQMCENYEYDYDNIAKYILDHTGKNVMEIKYKD